MLKVMEQLLQVQELDVALRRLDRELKDAPVRRAALDQGLVAAREDVTRAQAALKAKQAELKGQENEVETLKEKIQKHRKQQFEIKSNTEYKALEHEIHAETRLIRQIEDRQLETMEAMEPLRAALADADAALKRREASLRQEQAELDRRAGEATAEKEKLAAARAAAAAAVEPEWLARYTRIFQHRPDAALVRVDGGNCGGCHMQLPPQIIQDAKRAERTVSCAFCGRFLYVPN